MELNVISSQCFSGILIINIDGKGKMKPLITIEYDGNLEL